MIVKGEQGETRLAAKSVILATGSRPRSLPGMTPDGKAIVTSDEILELKEIPKSLVVIGAGAVGIEFASVFARFGSTVTVIELLPTVLPLEDEEISAEARKVLAKQMTIHTGARTEAALKIAHGVEVAFRNTAGEAKSLTAEMLLVAVGRGPGDRRPGPGVHQGPAREGLRQGQRAGWRPTSRASTPSATW